jgi:hypothetical protein
MPFVSCLLETPSFSVSLFKQRSKKAHPLFLNHEKISPEKRLVFYANRFL